MIIRTEVDGRPALVQYLTADREPSTEEDAEMVYVIFDDGDTMYAFAADDEEESETEEEPPEKTTDRAPKIKIHIHR